MPPRSSCNIMYRRFTTPPPIMRGHDDDDDDIRIYNNIVPLIIRTRHNERRKRAARERCVSHGRLKYNNGNTKTNVKTSSSLCSVCEILFFTIRVVLYSSHNIILFSYNVRRQQLSATTSGNRRLYIGGGRRLVRCERITRRRTRVLFIV